MKSLYAFVITVMVLCQTTLFAQKTTDLSQQTLLLNTNNTHEKVNEISKNFKTYSLFSLDTRALYSYLQNGNGKMDVMLNNEKVTVSYVRNNVVSDDYQLFGANDNGQYPIKSTIRTYEGRLSGANSSVAITSNEGYFSLMVEKDGANYYIEPADNMSSSTKGMYILYKNTDYIGTEKFTCAHKDSEKATTEVVDGARGVLGACLRVEWGIAADYYMYTKYSNNVANVEARTVTVYNLATVNYKNAFNNDFEFKILKQVVATTANAINVSTSTDISTVLTSFNTWVDGGNLNFNNGKPDLASFWSNRDYDGAAVGLAYLAATCGNARTQVIQDFATNIDEQRCTVAHETGHNFTMEHDASGAPYIMAPVVSSATTFSALSKTALNTYVAGVLAGGNNCLSSCAVPGQKPTANFTYSTSAVCVGGKVEYIDDSTNDPTSWGWTFAGGTPAASALEDVTVTYNTIGIFDVTHTATNANGTGSVTKTGIVRVDTNPNTYCSAPGTSTSAGGIKQVKIAEFAAPNTVTLNSLSQSAAVETKYKDFSCSRIATLQANKDYEITLDIGDCNTNVIEHLKIWIDYNNNGLLSDAGELISYSSSGGFCGVVTSASGSNVSTLKIKTPMMPVFDKFLRMRVMTTTVSVQSNPCYSNLANIGQIEDYSVVFPSPFSSAPTSKDVTCFGGNDGEINLNVMGGTAPLTYTWSPATVTGNNPKNLVAGTYNVTVTDAGGATLTKSATINQPAAALTATATIAAASCGQANGSISVVAAGGNGGYHYTWSNTTKDTSAIGNLAGGAYLLTLTDAKGCSTTVTNTVNATGAVNVTFAGNTTVCSGVSTKITASGGVTYLWSNGVTTPSITVTPTATTTYYVTATAGACSKSDSVKVTVANTVAKITTPKTAICEGETVTLTATGGGTYAWSNTIKTADNAVKPTKTTTYTVTVTNNGCTATATQDITVNVVTGTVSASNTKPCAGETVTLTATGGGTYLWDNGTTADKNAVTTSGTNVFNVTITNTLGCSKTYAITITGVPALPKPVITLLGSNKFCEGGSAILSATANFPKYIWTGSTLTTQSITVTKSGTYTVKIVNGTCESAVSDPVVIDVQPLPAVPTITKSGTGSTLNSSSATGNLWFSSNTQNGVYTALAGAVNNTYKVTKTGWYYVQYTDANGCSSKSAVININVTGTKDLLNENQFNVFPNPMEDKLTVSLVEVPEANRFIVTNVLGQAIYTQTITAQTGIWTIDVSSWSKGTYFLNIINAKGEAIGTRKIAKVE